MTDPSTEPTPAPLQPQESADRNSPPSAEPPTAPLNVSLEKIALSKRPLDRLRLPNLPIPKISETWDQFTQLSQQLTKHLPTPQLLEPVLGWFRVDETKLKEILHQIRKDLPTTEAILIGKPQAGKSSIVRGLTGVSAEIIGQGFRPHTQHTQRYSYPTDELPLLQFVDTIGLGDGVQAISDVVRDLLGELASAPTVERSSLERSREQSGNADLLDTARTPSPDQPVQPDQTAQMDASDDWDGKPATAAKVILLTVRVGDFATDSLRQIVQQVRQKHPEVPCLLVVTCLHQLYPPSLENHPAYPPQIAEVDRAFAQIQQDFQGLFDRAVLIDFTLEEDGFDPVFYGLETLVNTLAELLPEAESRAIAQLLDDRSMGNQVGNLYREAARRAILPFAIMAGTLAAVPLPLATMPVLTAVQISMVAFLGQLYGQKLTVSQAGGLVSTIAGGFLAQTIGRELVKLIPGFGSVIAASWATAYTWALGETACAYFGDLLGGRKPDPAQIQAVMKSAFADAQDRLKKPTMKA
ncbi:YcjF family protein [Alkalinema pantanalense CENA528]|uniref:YcjF family protein n=1 Tax=Alkalinema pantanalense TaxID=1620705 RepID=UPI003D6E6273